MKDGVIPDGYKLTEVGVIPCDWNCYKLGDIVTFSGGSQPPRTTFIFKQKKGYLRLIQIRDYKTDDFITYIPEQLAQKQCSLDDIMIGRYGPPIFQILRGLEGAYNVALIKAMPFEEVLNKSFLYYFLKQDSLFQFIESLSQRTSGQTGIDMNELKKYPLPLPPLPEQKRIAKALSDIDELITALDKLITKKRYLKQGAMQQLLTGKTRLPGFTGAWEVRRLAEECEMITKGTTPTSLGKNFQSNGINFIKIESLGDNGNLIKDKMAFIDIETHYLLRRSQLKENDILVSIAGALGRILMIKKTMLPANINQALSIVRLKINANLNHVYLVYFLKSQNIRQQIESINVQAAQANLSLENINDFLISLPPLPEQKAIAKILTQMDEEIEALEKKRDKYKKIKQGMMSVLLTGRIRLM